MTSSKNKFVANKIKKIMREGVRVNTRQPLSKSNPRKPVSDKRAVAIAESMYSRGKK